MRMLSNNIIKRLSRIEDLPSIPIVLTEIMTMLDDENLKSKNLAETIERDQMLTTRVLRVANSPYYGFTRKISTIELAIALIGINTIRDIVTGIMVKRIFIDTHRSVIDLDSYWKYSIFCAGATKYFAAKLKYRPLGESFVTGLMHDMGVLLLSTYFSHEYKEVLLQIEMDHKYSLVQAEQKILQTNHAEVASWLADKWNLPSKICVALKNHHYYFSNVDVKDVINEQPLTVAVALSEYFAKELGFMTWNNEKTDSKLFIGPEIFTESDDTMLDASSSISLIKQDLLKEFEKYSFFTEM
ncbi:MAG: HDOD domain-containing protein [Candidatus Kapaibacterium sp.]